MSNVPVPVATLTYEPFSLEPEYIEVNRAFIAELGLGARRVIADLAAGTGAMTALVLDALPLEPDAGRRQTTVVGIELSDEAIGLAQAHVSAVCRDSSAVAFVRGSIDDLPLPVNSLDAAVIGNAIQLLPDKKGLVREIHSALRPEGLFGFNTSFYAGAYLAGTERFYLQWVQQAVRYITASRSPTAFVGKERRHRGKATPAFSNRWLSPDEYRQLLEGQGFELVHEAERTVDLTIDCLRSIGAYPGLASVLLSGYPVPLACEALAAAAEPALDACGLTVVPRGWLEMSAIKADASCGPR